MHDLDSLASLSAVYYVHYKSNIFSRKVQNYWKKKIM